MKCLILFISITLSVVICHAQGLNKVVVEKYYISESSDTLAVGSRLLPAGSVTYRVFVDMQPGYRLQAIYGSSGHELKISTTTFFFNHPNYGQYVPNLIMDFSLRYNAVMLDSWLSMGAGSQDSYGILKEQDDTLSTIVNNFKPQLLQAESMESGKPVKSHDGLLFGKGKPPRVTTLGIDSLLLNLDKLVIHDSGYVFTTTNGSWACLQGAIAPPGEANRILIGQFTTNGIFSFELNMQLGKPGSGVEQYVAKNPSGLEFGHNSLIYSSHPDSVIE